MAKKKKSQDIMKRRHQKMIYKQNHSGRYQKTLDLSPNKNKNTTPYKNVSFACFDDKENHIPLETLNNIVEHPRDFQNMINQVSPIRSKALKSRNHYKPAQSDKSPCDESKRDLMMSEPFQTPRNENKV